MANLNSQYVELKIDDGTSMLAWVSRPAAEEPKRGMLVFQEAFGVNTNIRDVADRFAALGYAAIAPELFHRTVPPKWEGSYTDLPAAMPHLQALTETGLEHDGRAAYNWLLSNSAVGGNVGCIGFCMGGRAAFLANSVLPLKAAVSYYGGNMPALLGRTPKLSAPMLLFWGELDHHIPAEHRTKVTAAMREAGKEYVDVVFSNADHGFFCDERASYQPKAAKLAWDLTKSFLDSHL